jgi:hypothetical protein
MANERRKREKRARKLQRRMGRKTATVHIVKEAA